MHHFLHQKIDTVGEWGSLAGQGCLHGQLPHLSCTYVRLQNIIALCEEKTRLTSCHLCRSLSAVGRRVLSIESFGALQGKHVHTYVQACVHRHMHMDAHMHT